MAVLRLVVAFLLLAGTARAADLPVDLELVLAVDVSGSVDDVEANQQRRGYVAAFADASVIDAIRANRFGRIAVTYVEWAGLGDEHVVLDWTLIGSDKDAGSFADRLAETPIGRGRWTSLSGVIDYAVPLFAGNGYAGTRRAIDISGDGPNNSGRAVDIARDEAVAQGITINGVPILDDRPQPWNIPTPIELGLDHYYAEHVIGGTEAFVIPAKSFEDFRRAILAKLVREIAGLPGPRLAAR